jgi:transcriptional regulator with XRE-family HTH domain
MCALPVSHRIVSKNGDFVEPSKPHTAEDFSKRLDTALHGHPHAPPGHGRQRWLRGLVAERTGLQLSPEAVRKWFSGQARPRPDVMKKLAQALEVDEAWLSLGVGRTERPVDTKKRNATADGAVNLVAGLLQMQGGHIAFGEDPNEGVDIYAILNGKKLDIEVKMAREYAENQLRIALSPKLAANTVIAVVPNQKGLTVKLLWLTPALIKEHGRRKGGYVEIILDQNGTTYKAGETNVPQINAFKTLLG